MVNFHAARQRRPLRGKRVTVTETLPNGVQLILQRHDRPCLCAVDRCPLRLQSVHLPAVWSVSRARSWLRRHGYSDHNFERARR